jgi:hypothetical protein
VIVDSHVEFGSSQICTKLETFQPAHEIPSSAGNEYDNAK